MADSWVWQINRHGYRYNICTYLPEDGRPYNDRVNVLSGRGMLIPVEVFGVIGNFDCKRFPHYIADYEFSMRAYQAGVKLVMSMDSVVYAKSEMTGIHKEAAGPFSPMVAWRMYFDRRSSHNLRDHLAFVMLRCPMEYRILNICRIIGYALARLKGVGAVMKSFIHAYKRLRG